MMYKYVISVLVCLVPSQVTASTHPTIPELLDKYAEMQHKLESYIVQSETSCAAKTITLLTGRRIPNKGIPPQNKEIRTDGDRFYICERHPSALHIPSTVFIPNDQWSRTWLWDGKTYYFYGHHTKEYVKRYAEKYIDDPERRDRYARRATGSITVYTNTDEPNMKKRISEQRPDMLGYSRVYSLLRDAEKVSVLDKMETIDGSECYAIEAETGLFKSRVWIDPVHGFHIAKMTTWCGGKKFFVEWNVVFKSIDGIWIPVQKDLQHFNSGGKWSEDKHRYRITKVILNPDHDALESFAPAPQEGSSVSIKGAAGTEEEREYRWQNGRIMDEDGREADLEKLKLAAKRAKKEQ